MRFVHSFGIRVHERREVATEGKEARRSTATKGTTIEKEYIDAMAGKYSSREHGYEVG